MLSTFNKKFDKYCIMSGELQSKIQRFIYNLSVEDYAQADADLKQIIDIKHEARFNEVYEKVAESFANSKKNQ